MEELQLLKRFLIKNRGWKEGEDGMGLNEECKETSYILGRIFAVLESIQKDANPGINATIRDRYFNSALCNAGINISSFDKIEKQSY